MGGMGGSIGLVAWEGVGGETECIEVRWVGRSGGV
jgi:hypothetical protein